MAGAVRLPALHKPLHRAVGTPVAFGLQAFEQPPGGAPLPLRQAGFNIQPLLQLLQEVAQLGRGLMLALVDGFLQRLERLADRGTGKLQTLRDGADAFPADKMTPSDFGYEFHA